MKPVSASLIAEYILSLSNPKIGDIISNLKLQKLLYYCQGFHLVVFGQPLFKEDIINWDHGPVVKEVYHIYNKHKDKAIPIPKSFESEELKEEQKELIKEVYDAFGQFSAWRLREMTHEEPPWINTSYGETITHDSLNSYFKNRIKDDEDEKEKPT